MYIPQVYISFSDVTLVRVSSIISRRSSTLNTAAIRNYPQFFNMGIANLALAQDPWSGCLLSCPSVVKEAWRTPTTSRALITHYCRIIYFSNFSQSMLCITLTSHLSNCCNKYFFKTGMMSNLFLSPNICLTTWYWWCSFCCFHHHQ